MDERIREIGLKRALGARRIHIQLQFLAEALVLMLLGGAIGITLSGYAYGAAGWHGVAALGLIMLTIPLITGVQEMRHPAVGAKPREKLSHGV